MPWGSVRLIPGVNVERTPTLNEAGVSSSQLIRYRDGLIQKFGGWSSYLSTTTLGVPRALHAWEDLNGSTWLAVGTPSQLAIIPNGTTIIDITPQVFTSSSIATSTFIINWEIGGQTVQFLDSAIKPSYTAAGPSIVSSITPNIDAIYFNTPVGLQTAVLNEYFSGFFTSGVQVPGAGTTAFSVGLSIPQGLGNGSAATFLPQFTTLAGSAYVQVSRVLVGAAHLQQGSVINFDIPTTANGVTISGAYVVQTPTTGSSFYILASQIATGSGTFSMNSGNVSLTYYLAVGVSPGNEMTGTKLSAADWSLANWGEILLACPSNGPIFQWFAGNETLTANPVGTAPAKNGGIFVSNAQQVLICWASSGSPNQTGSAFGVIQNPLQVAWSNVGDYTTFGASSTNQAGSFVIPSGSTCRGGMSVASQNIIWTDIDCWAMNYLGFPLVYGFSKIGAGAGLIAQHATMLLRGVVYWMGPSNFFRLTGNGVEVIPCPVWDFVFQNMNTAHVANIRAMPNTPFNEVGWLFPSAASSGECDSYVKFNVTEQGEPWDYGTISRSAWIDQSVLGNPISADLNGNLWVQETGNNAGGSAMTSSFTTSYFMIQDGEDFAFVDFVVPDMIWGTYSGPKTANVQLTFNIVDYPGDAPRTFGPFTVTQGQEFITPRMRGRQMSITVTSNDSGSFWRLGRIRYRFAQSGRR